LKRLLLLLFTALLALNSCKKEISSAGVNLLNNEKDAFDCDTLYAMEVGSVKVDTVSSSNPSYLLLGSYVDSIFGKYDASFYAQARISALKPDFGDVNSIVVDSLILGMRFSDNYGKLDAQNFEVYELTQDLLASSSYNTKSTATFKPHNLVLPSSMKLIPKFNGYKFPEKLDDKVIDTIRDNIRLQLDTELAYRFIKDSKNKPTNFATMDAFLTYFKGLHVKVANYDQQIGAGGVMSFGYPPVLTIYYKLAGVSKKFYFELNTSGVRFNHVDCDFTGTKVEKLVLKELLDQQDFYTQANHIRGTVNLTSINTIPSNSVIHYAKLILPVDYTNTNLYGLSNELFVSIPNSKDDQTLRYITSAVLDKNYNGYTVDVRDHIQQVVSGKRQKNPLFFSPKFFSLSAERVHFKGPNTSGADKPRLLIKYSTF
jgi:hypothetical protein